MKKAFFLLALCALAPFAAFSQTMSIDSVVIRPAAPDANDMVWLHIYGYSPNGTSLNGPITVLNAGNSHHADACYTVGLISVITYIHDSVFLFQGPAGMHTVSWTITQNGSQATSCDQPVTAGQMQVNVTTVLGIEDANGAAPILSWNAPLEAMSCAADGTLSVYGVNGQLLLRRNVAAGTLVKLPEGAEGVVIAVLEDGTGRSGRMKINCAATPK